MPEKYFATVMKKTEINKDDFIYSVESIVAGDIDDKTKILTSTSGKKYKNIRDFSDFDNTSEYYANAIKVDHITDYFDKKYSFPDAIFQFEHRHKQIFYYVSRFADDEFLILPIDKEPYVKMMNNIKNNQDEYEGEDLSQVSIEETEEINMDDGDDLVFSIKKIANDVLNSDLPPKELAEFRNNLEKLRNDIDSAIESIDIKNKTTPTSEKKKLWAQRPRQASVPSPTSLSQNEDELGVININDIFDKVTHTLIAQDKPARRAIVELSRLADMSKKDYGILLTGESGVGKTLLMTLLARYINRPLLIVDSTQLTAPGFVGKSIEEYLWDLYEDCGRDLKKAENAIIYFDEIDKKGSERKSDISGQAVLNTLLKFIDGTTYTAAKSQQHLARGAATRINTENMIVVAGGAFLDVYKNNKKSTAGFISETEDKSVEPEIEDFMQKGLMTKEFMARVPIIIHLDDLNVDAVRRVLVDSDESILKLQEEVFEKRGVKLTTKDGYILSVSNQALERKIGVRGLNKIVADTTWEAYDEISSNPGIYKEVILTEETAKDPSVYQLVKKN